MTHLKKFLLPALITALLAAGALPLISVQGADSPWISVGPGIDYQPFEMPGPTHVYVARMERANERLTLESVIANATLSSGGEFVSKMGQRMEQSISAWQPGSGARNRVVVAINGSGYTAQAEPKSGMIVEGFYAKRFDDAGGGSGFGWRSDRAAFIGRCVSHDPDQQIVSFPDLDGGGSVAIAGINVPRGSNQLILYTPQYGANTGTSDGELEVVVEFQQPFLIQSNPGVVGVVTDIREGGGSTLIPYDAIVLSASGSAKETLLASLSLNSRVEVSQRIQHTDWDCLGENTFSWAHTYASMHGDYAVLRDGEVYPKTDDAGAIRREPRTVIAYNDEYIFFFVVDGRTSESAGMTFEELGQFARDNLGASWAIAQDGGGSSVMVINGLVVNKPVSKCTPGAQSYLPLVTQTAPFTLTPTRPAMPGVVEPTPEAVPDLYACERAVANSMMMVYLEDPVFSPAGFEEYDQVLTNAETQIRLGPGTNYQVIQTVPSNTGGAIQPHLGSLNGVFAKGSYWWKVNLGGVVGWAPETNLVYIATPPGNFGVNLDLVAVLGD